MSRSFSNLQALINDAGHPLDAWDGPAGATAAYTGPMPRYRFGVFELDSEAGELRRSGMLVKLAPQPLAILSLLIRRSGSVVTRDEIRQEVWGAGTFVDPDRNLNVSVAQIRAALGDDADTPRFVQTVPRRGYKFVGGAEQVGEQTPKLAPRPYRWAAAGIALAAGLVAGTLAWRNEPKPPDRPLIAVLPFDDLSEDGDTRRKLLRDGVMEELITLLGG